MTPPDPPPSPPGPGSLSRWLRALPSGWGPVGAELLIVTPLYVLGALVFTFPLALNLHDHVIGDLEGDMWKHLWGMWWVHHNLVELNVLPLHTELLNYPYGGALFFIDPLNGLLSTPLQLLMSPTVAYNLMVLFNLVLAGVGGFVLARHLSGNPFAAFFAGGVFAFSAYMMAYITSGVTEAINIGWIPLFVTFYLKMLRHHRFQDAVRAGLAFGVAAVACWYYGAFCVLFGSFAWLYRVLRVHRRPLRVLRRAALRAARPPWSPGVIRAARVLVALGLTLWLSARTLDPYLGGRVDFLGAALAFTATLWGAARWVGGEPGVALQAWDHLRRVALPLGLLAFQIGFAGTLGSAEAGPRSELGIRLTLVGLSGWTSLALWRGRGQLLGAGRLLLPLASSAGSILVTAMIPFSVWTASVYLSAAEGGAAGGVELVRGSLALSAFAGGLAWSLARRPASGPPGDRLTLLQAAHRAHAHLWIGWAALSALLLRLGWPEAPFAPYLFTWVLAQGLAGIALLGACRLRDALGRALLEGGAARFRELSAGFWRPWVWTPLCMGAVAAVLIVPTAWEFRQTINGENSLVYRKREAANVDLYLSRRFLNVTRLEDYVTPGKSTPTRSYTVDKLTRASYAGWVTLGVIALGLSRVRRPMWRFWLWMAGIFAMFSLGPYLYITEDLYSQKPSVVYMAFHRYFPTFSQVSIPYRFTALVMMSLSVLAAYSLTRLLRGWSRTSQALLVGALTLGVLFEVAMFSPAPYPIPLSSAEAPEYCQRLAEEPGEFGVVDIPFQRFKGELLPGEYFFYQMVHRKPIPNKVEGTIPVYVFQNPFTSYLFVLEHSYSVVPPERVKLEQGLEDLSRFRFRYLIVHDNLLRRSVRERIHTLLGFYLGEPERHPQNIFLYRVPPGLRFSTSAPTSQASLAGLPPNAEEVGSAREEP